MQDRNGIFWAKLGPKTSVACWQKVPESPLSNIVLRIMFRFLRNQLEHVWMDTEQWPWWIIVCWFCSWSWANPRQILIDLTTDLHSGRWLGRARVLGTEMESIWAAMLELLLIIHSVKYIISRPRDRLGPPALLPHAGHTTIADPQHNNAGCCRI